jgi:CRISPR-associated protein Cmr6
METIGLVFEPLDTLFFRGGRPFGAGLPGESSLPSPQSLAGVVRTYLLDRENADFAAMRGKPTLREAFAAAGAPWVADVRFRGPWLAESGDDGPRPLLRAPADLRFVDGEVVRLLPTTQRVPGWQPPLSDMYPLWSTKGKPSKSRPEMLSLEGLSTYDALPVQWPKLIIDILNNHHRLYYEGLQDKHHENPPGDWEEPVPVNFLAIAAGTEFEFWLAARRGVADSARLLNLAKNWIDGALAWFGAGAKTNAGYGRFNTGTALPTGTGHGVFNSVLTLATPAFLAGSLQEMDDCALRSATLRGLLRWWWRTMHAGHMTPREMLKLERLLWGGIAGSNAEGSASAISISLEPIGSVSPVLYRKQEVANAHGLRKPTRPKAMQGVAYITYGMDDRSRSRYYVPDGTRWELRIIADPVPPLPSQQVLDQAQCALWLLMNFGGSGSKARKGFGCIEGDAGTSGIAECVQRAMEIRTAMGLQNRSSGFLRQSPSLEDALGPVDVSIPTKDVWCALDQLGDAIQEFAQLYKHRVEKKALGLPRRMKESDPELQQLGRHSSPVHFHLRNDGSGFRTTIIAFPSEKLRGFDKNRDFLQKFIDHLQGKQFIPSPSGSRAAAATLAMSVQRPAPTPLKVGAIVEGVLLEERTKKGGWKAREARSGLAGPIQNSQAVPSGAKAGDTVKLKVRIASAKEAAFEYVP